MIEKEQQLDHNGGQQSALGVNLFQHKSSVGVPKASPHGPEDLWYL